MVSVSEKINIPHGKCLTCGGLTQWPVQYMYLGPPRSCLQWSMLLPVLASMRCQAGKIYDSSAWF